MSRPSPVAAWDDLMAVVEEASTLTLATLDADGSPRATPLCFAVETSPDPNPSFRGIRGGAFGQQAPLAFLFLSDPSSIHIGNLTRDPRTSVALYPCESDWRRLRGAQAKGQALPVADRESEAAMAIYRSRVSAVDDVPEAAAHSRLFRFRPTWIRCIDNRKGFGRHEEWTWS